MRTAKRIAVVLLPALLLLAWVVVAQKPQQDERQSALDFVQTFYDWYVAKAVPATSNTAPWREALKNKGSSFSSELVQALMHSEVEAKQEGDPVLDFDPILDSQDPSDHYVAKKAAEKDGHYWVEVYGVSSAIPLDRKKEPDVVAEVVFEDGHWKFVNFHYPGSKYPASENLLSILRYRYHGK